MKARGVLTVICQDGGTAGHLEEVLAPDNAAAPRDQRLSTSRSGPALTLAAEGDSSSALISTFLSILTDTELFQEVWLLSRGTGGRGRKRS